jgi:type IV secretory pathway VirB2 component (pilin)
MFNKNFFMIKKIMVFLFVFSVFTSTSVFAADPVSSSDGSDGGSMAVVLCNAMNFVTGTVGKTLASFVIIGVGLGFFTGKTSWGTMIGVTLGVSALFGAPAIIKAVTGGGNICDSNS